jgi:glycosyltransferase involved in cell wall biosynthesis
MASVRFEQKPQDALATGEGVSQLSDRPIIMVGIPSYNEEIAIGSLVLRVSQYADKVVVLDDGSTDRTADIARLAGAEVIQHDKNLGKGAALRDLFAYATQCDVDVLVIIDGDGQHNPDDIPLLVSPVIRGEADFVNGSRYLIGKSDTPSYRRFGQLVLDNFTRVGSGRDLPVTDTQSGFRAFSMKTAHIFKFTSNTLGIESEMLMDAAKAQLRIKEVDVSVRYDVGRSSTHPITHGLEVLVGVLRNIEFKKPLLAFTAPGLLLIGIGIALAAYVVQGFNAYGHVPNGPAILMLLVTIVGTFMVLTGIILHSLAGLTESLEAAR